MMIANNVLTLLFIYCTSIVLAFQISYLHPRHRPSSHLAASTSTTSFTTSIHHHCNKSSPKLLLDSIDEILTLQSQSLSISPSDILNNVNIQHEQDVAYAKSSSLPFENDNISMSGGDDYKHMIEYETIPPNNNEEPPIAIQTPQSILNKDEIKLLTNACETYWNRNKEETQSSKSRFTYQRKGNSEAHLSDVVQYHASQQQHGLDTSDSQSCSSVEHLVNDLLLNRVYPWVRTAYLSNEEDISVDELELYVYDSLFIRYNATEASLIDEGSQESRESVEADQESRVGAGQPLHRDLGYVSINIILNSQDDFEGGGTFFEDQLLPIIRSSSSDDQLYEAEVRPLKPKDVGHAIAHYSSNRHAGAATLKGVRDILVMFIAAATLNKQSTTQPSSSSIPSTDNDFRIQYPPQWELNARIKSAARSYCTTHCSNNIEDQVICRILHHRLAIDQVEDGEAWHYLGMALLDYHNHQQVESSSNEATNIEGTLELAISCLNVASEYTPCDGRIYNNLGIALERQQSSMREDLHSKIVSAYEKSIMIHSKCESVGCDVGADYESACLNYGLYLSKLDLFDDAIDVLSRIVGGKFEHQSMVTAEEDEMDAAGWARQRIRQDALGLLSFCKRQVE